MDCFRLRSLSFGGQVVASLLAMTWTDLNTTSHSRGAMRPKFCWKPCPRNTGRREDRVRAAPAVSCAMCIKNAAHEHTGLAEASGLPCAMALRLIRFRPGDRLSCHHRQLRLSLSLSPT